MSSRRCGFCAQPGHYRTTCPLRLETMNINPIQSSDEEISDSSIVELGTLQELLEEPDFNTFYSSDIMDIPSAVMDIPSAVVNTPSVIDNVISVVVDMPSGSSGARLPATQSAQRSAAVHTHNDRCPICMEDLGTQAKTELECNHSYCTKCIMANLEYGNLVCPICRSDIMGPSKKIVELNTIIDKQHSELCDQDSKLDLYEVKFRSYESNSKTQENKYNAIKDVLLTGLEMDNIEEAKQFTRNISSMYTTYKDAQVKLGVCPNTVPKLSEMMYASFSIKQFTYASIPIIKDRNQSVICHDSWVKIISGKYRNYMARVIWVQDYNIDTPSNIYNGTYIIRVYMGLGKPKLGKGIYDRSYTRDIKFHITNEDSPFYSGTSLYEGTSAESLICPQMIVKIPPNIINYKINGNTTKLPVEIKSLLNRGDMEIILQREP